jgi:hypothetical protein
MDPSLSQFSSLCFVLKAYPEFMERIKETAKKRVKKDIERNTTDNTESVSFVVFIMMRICFI